MRVLITGHTGFKGAWLTMMLSEAGHRVSGISLDPEPNSLFTSARLHDLLEHDFRVDIRDFEATTQAVEIVSPDVVYHLAAQPLVRESYREPRATIESNVIGTMNMLDAVSRVGSVQAHVVITTDKVYKNVEVTTGYKETAPLGAGDPYSSSKAMADILTQSWVKSFDGPPTAIARGGNVIGGGDHGAERLLPDLVRYFKRGETAKIRFPDAVRPWQHVLDCLSGYIRIADALLDGRGTGEWNIGPGRESFISVGTLATLAAERWGGSASWEPLAEDQPHEAGLLSLDPSKAEAQLGFRNKLVFPSCLDWVIDWHKAVNSGQDPRAVSVEQIRNYSRSESE